MLLGRLDKWARLGAGLGVILLLVAQEKVWPWIARPQPTADATQVAETQTPPASNPEPSDDSDQAPHSKRVLPHLTLEAAFPRWASGFDAAARHEALQERDGVIAAGSLRPTATATPNDTNDDVAALWRVQLVIQRLAAPATARAALPPHPALHSVLQRTGPPVA